MYNDLKLALQSFKRSWKDYLSISFVFSMIIFIGILLGNFVLGMLIGFIIVIIPAIISLKFCAYQAHDKQEVQYRSLKIGFITFFKSLRIYLLVIFKPLLISFLIGLVIYSLFLDRAIVEAGQSIEGLTEALANYETFQYTYNKMLEIENVKKILTFGQYTSLIVGYLIFFLLKLKRDFIPFIAFEMPINSKRAVSINGKILEKKKYLAFAIVNLTILAMFILPLVIALLVRMGLQSNEVLSPTTINLLTMLSFVVTCSPVVMLQQLHYAHAYKTYSKPYKEDFNNELKNVLKEMEELVKKIDENK